MLISPNGGRTESPAIEFPGTPALYQLSYPAVRGGLPTCQYLTIECNKYAYTVMYFYVRYITFIYLLVLLEIHSIFCGSGVKAHFN